MWMSSSSSNVIQIMTWWCQHKKQKRRHTAIRKNWPSSFYHKLNNVNPMILKSFNIMVVRTWGGLIVTAKGSIPAFGTLRLSHVEKNNLLTLVYLVICIAILCLLLPCVFTQVSVDMDRNKCEYPWSTKNNSWRKVFLNWVWWKIWTCWEHYI